MEGNSFTSSFKERKIDNETDLFEKRSSAMYSKLGVSFPLLVIMALNRYH
jgi:hypothetical protein